MPFSTVSRASEWVHRAARSTKPACHSSSQAAPPRAGSRPASLAGNVTSSVSPSTASARANSCASSVRSESQASRRSATTRTADGSRVAPSQSDSPLRGQPQRPGQKRVSGREPVAGADELSRGSYSQQVGEHGRRKPGPARHIAHEASRRTRPAGWSCRCPRAPRRRRTAANHPWPAGHSTGHITPYGATRTLGQRASWAAGTGGPLRECWVKAGKESGRDTENYGNPNEARIGENSFYVWLG